MTDEPSQTLQSFVFDERERGRFTHEDFQEAPAILGFGVGGTLGVEYDDDVPDERCTPAQCGDAWESGSVEKVGTSERRWHDPRTCLLDARGTFGD